MRKTLLITLLMVLGCSNPFESTTGSLSVKLIFPGNDNHLSKKLQDVAGLPPVTVEITVNPGNRVEIFNYDARSGVIDELDPGVYSVDAVVRDADGNDLLYGGPEEVEVKAGQQASVFIVLTQTVPELISPDNGAVLDNGCSNQSNLIIWDFDWTAVSGATSYNLFVISSCASLPVIDEVITDSDFHYVNDGYILNQNRLDRTWKVRAGFSGQWGHWSETRTFDVEPLDTDCQIIIQETYDGLSLGSTVPTWIPIRPQDDPTTPTVQNVSFNSAPHGAELTNDYSSLRPFPQPLTGIVIIEIWMDPKVGSDTNNFLRIVLNNASSGQDAVIGKNDSDRWFYTDASSGQVFFEPVDGEGHNIRVEYNTDTATYNLFFDRDGDGKFGSQDFSVFNVPYTGSAGLPVTGIDMNSGRGGIGTTSYFDDLVVSVNKQ